jgi:PleD family two-component response regulator
MSRRGTTLRDLSSTVLLVENGKTNQKRAHDLVRGLGHRVTAIEDPEEAEGVVARAEPPDVLLAGLPGAEDVVRAAVARGDRRPSVVVLLSLPSAEAAARCDELGADGYALRPLKKESIAAALRAALLLRSARRRIFTLEEQLATERSRLARFGDVDPDTGFHQFEFFQKLLVIELKRARRYGYPLAACLVAIDERTPPAPQGLRRLTHARVARVLRGVIRDIDLPVDYADGRFLVFLPYTDLAGAERVGRRLEAAVRRDEDGRAWRPTVSVGIAALRPTHPVSFARLVRDATVALKAAQLKGGGRVVVRAVQQ